MCSSTGLLKKRVHTLLTLRVSSNTSLLIRSLIIFPGIFDESGEMKSYIAELVIDCTKERTNIDPNAPVTPRPVDATTQAPIASPGSSTPVPTGAPVSAETSAPVAMPTTEAPAKGTTDSPTAAPVTEAGTLAPTVEPSQNPVDLPASLSTTTVPVTTVEPSSCELKSACNLLGLIGECCPTIDDWTLDCCNGGDYSDSLLNNCAITTPSVRR